MSEHHKDLFEQPESGERAVIDLTGGVSLHLEQFEAMRAAPRPEHPYVDHDDEFSSTDSYGVHIPRQVLDSGHGFITNVPGQIDLRVDNGWLSRLLPFKH